MKIKVQKEKEFLNVISLIQKAKQKAFLAVNTALIELYWDIGEYIGKKVESSEWGESIVTDLADFIAEREPELRGFNRRGLYRMMQFYNAYRQYPKVSSLLTQITWTNHLLILSKT